MISLITATLEAHFDAIRAECDALRDDEWVLWPEARAFQGRWLCATGNMGNTLDRAHG
ncbi:MAG: hypothetical protein AB7I19_09905 [Planctomycetota bacterium]